MTLPTALRWVGLAVLGILVAAAVSVAASRLASQEIGLSSQPISAGDALAPPVPRPAESHKAGGPPRAAAPSQPAPPPAPEPETAPESQPVPAGPETTTPGGADSGGGDSGGDGGDD
jgi:hypothetical protein